MPEAFERGLETFNFLLWGLASLFGSIQASMLAHNLEMEKSADQKNPGTEWAY
jgi:hypothetical protein